MSRENVERIRGGMEAFNRRDIDGLLEILDPEVEWHPPAEFPGVSPYHGHDGVRQAVADMVDAFGDLTADPERFIDTEDRVVALYHWRGRGSGSGVPVDQFDVPVGMVATIAEGGLATDVRFYTTWEQALEVADLDE